ncbi:syntaxin-18 isoform X2 [Symphalangus syndactylus]|uniref:syntaxin-18 isoform X2 n=1 Tax=Symphalangus syndactylus TaxID=9590 RepID=UPI0005D03DA1|nr:syntaxin-18 isoform X1 [Symphalangus syndactylus]|eukprot:XP_011511782.1 syntaxin-18 isoform X1 [Homo sapiens]
MAVDITLLFRASVKTVKTRNKALGVAVGGGVDGSRDELFRRSPRPKGDFSSRAREVISHIGKLRDFLLEHRKDYINAYSHTMSEYGRMTDTERDQIDQDAQIFMRTCSEAIQQLRTEAHKEIHSQQVKEHRTAVLDFIEDYLKRVCKLYSEQRAIRVKRVVDKKRLAFAGGIKEGQAYLGDITGVVPDSNKVNITIKSKLEPEPNTKTRESTSSEKVSQSPSKDSEENPATEERPEKILAETQPELGTWGDGKGEDELSPEEIQMFEQENQRLIGEMNSLFDEVRQIEGRVVEISRLQEIFTEKVLQQEAEIDSIHQLVVGATENIKEGNEDIREAIKNNAGFRVWILFFLVMCSFSLLFLDWYDS